MPCDCYLLALGQEPIYPLHQPWNLVAGKQCKSAALSRCLLALGQKTSDKDTALLLHTALEVALFRAVLC